MQVYPYKSMVNTLAYSPIKKNGLIVSMTPHLFFMMNKIGQYFPEKPSPWIVKYTLR